MELFVYSIDSLVVTILHYSAKGCGFEIRRQMAANLSVTCFRVFQCDAHTIHVCRYCLFSVCMWSVAHLHLGQGLGSWIVYG